MRILMFILTVVVIGVVLFFLLRNKASLDPEQVTNYPPDGDTIVAFGDSLVVGVGAETEGGFVTMLADELDVSIENLGRGGDTTADGIERLDEIISRDPDIVLLLLGGNDFLGQVSQEETFANLDTIVTRLHEGDTVVVVLGVRGGVLRDHFRDGFQALAKKHGTAYVPDVLNGLAGESRYMNDAIHPNEEGYTIIAGRVAPVLRVLLE